MLYIPCVSRWEAGRRKQSPRFNALPSVVAREQEKQVGSIYFIHQRAKKWLKLGSEDCPPEPMGCSPCEGRGWWQQSDGPAIPPLPFLLPFQSQGSEDPLRDPAS